MPQHMFQHVRLAGIPAVMFAVLGGIAVQTATADPLPYGPDTCIQGYVWREARPGDTVCVEPAVRDRTLQENATAAQGREPNGGAYGPNTCRSGLVWREAFDGDTVCVTTDIRHEAWNDNAAAASRKAANAPIPTPAAKDPYRDCSRICPGTG
jgi:hypothetical protein